MVELYVSERRSVEVAFGRGFGGARVVFDADEGLARRFAAVYGNADAVGGIAAEEAVLEAVVRGGDDDMLSVRVNGTSFCGLDAAQTVGALDAAFEGCLRGFATPGLCTAHACGLVGRGGAVALLGTSGAGKTTLGLACALSGLEFAGDEFGFLDLKDGGYCHASYPVFLKEGTLSALGCGHLGGGLPIESLRGLHAEAYAPEYLAHAWGMKLASPSVALPLRAVIALRRGCSSNAAQLVRLSVARWVEEVMPSLDAPVSRSQLLLSLVALASRCDIGVFRIEYSDVHQAAALLAEKFG